MKDANDSGSPKIEIDGVEILSSTTSSRRLTPEENAKMTITGGPVTAVCTRECKPCTCMLACEHIRSSLNGSGSI